MKCLKEICQACLNAEVPLTTWGGQPWEDFLWDESNEKCWEKGELCCPAKEWEMISKKRVPNGCLRKFEYAILGQRGARKLVK